MYGAVDSDEEVIGHQLNSDDDGGHQWLEFNPKTDMKNPRFCNGLLFATPRILRAVIRERAIQKGWVPLWDKNDKRRLRAICQADNCNYELYASKMQHEDTFQIKRYQPNHNCVRLLENPTIRTPYLITRFAHMIQLNPDIKTEALMNSMAAELQAKVSLQQAYRTKRAVLEQLEMSMKEQYARVQDYAHELKRVDPATTVDIKCDRFQQL